MRKSFTLIELLVVIAIISGLAALLLPNYMAARERARDAQRKSDLHQIQKALEMYKLDQSDSAYQPNSVSDPPHLQTTAGSSWTAANGTTYMSKVPQDPNFQYKDYYYALNNTDSQKYTLCACLENKADSDGINCETVGTGCAGFNECHDVGSDMCYVLHEP